MAAYLGRWRNALGKVGNLRGAMRPINAVQPWAVAPAPAARAPVLPAIQRFASVKSETLPGNKGNQPSARPYQAVPDDSKDTVYMAMLGNSLILVLKGVVYLRTGSSAMLAETVHTLADTLNQVLLWLGLRQSQTAPDTRHPYGYGKAAYFWSLVSALGLFWCGAGVSVFHGVFSLLNPTPLAAAPEMWAVLAGSLAVDGYVLGRALNVILGRALARAQAAADPTHSDHDAEFTGPHTGLPAVPGNMGMIPGFSTYLGTSPWWRPPLAFSFDSAAPLRSSLGMARAAYWYVRSARDPFVTAVFLEDAVACTGVVVAAGGISLSFLTGSPVWDSLASIAIGGMLGGVAVQLVRMNHRYLLGHSVESSTLAGIRGIITSLPSIDAVGDVQSTYVGPNAFTYKAQVDFDGTYLSARLQSAYLSLFTSAAAEGRLDDELPLLLSLYAEDVTRLVEKELKEVESRIRAAYPAAVYIELEPDSKHSDSPMHSLAGDAAARTSEEKALWQQLTAVLAARAAKRPDDPSIVSEQARLNAWFLSAETRERSRSTQAGPLVEVLTPDDTLPPSPRQVQVDVEEEGADVSDALEWGVDRRE